MVVYRWVGAVFFRNLRSCRDGEVRENRRNNTESRTRSEKKFPIAQSNTLVGFNNIGTRLKVKKSMDITRWIRQMNIICPKNTLFDIWFPIEF